MRPEGQPPSDRIARVFLTLLLSPRRRRHDSLQPVSTRKRMPPLLKPVVARVVRARTCDRCKWTSSPDLLRRARRGEEAATPGQPVALSAFLEVYLPGRFTLGNRRLPLARRNHPAESGIFTFRVNPLSSSFEW